MSYLLYGYMFLFIERPWEIWPSLAGLHIERVYMLLVLAIFLLLPKPAFRWHIQHLWVLLFLLLHFLLAPFAFSPADALNQGFEYFKVVTFYFLLVWSIRDEQAFRKFLFAFIVVMGMFMSHSFREYLCGRHECRMDIVRMIGVGGLNDPNAFAASIVFSLPFLRCLAQTERNKFYKLGYLGYGLLSAVCIVLTGSRSGFVTLVLFLALESWSFIRKSKRTLTVLIVLPIVAVLAWQLIPDDKKLRIETIWDSGAGPANAADSAQGRIEGLKAGLRMFLANPLTGVGAGGENFIKYRVAKDDGTDLQAHNLLGQLLGEMGLFGAMTFLAQILTAWSTSNRVAALDRAFPGTAGPFLSSFARAARTALVLMLFCGMFSHNLYRFLWLWIFAWLALASQFSEDRAREGLSGCLESAVNRYAVSYFPRMRGYIQH
jgi:O-antigen ligase